MIHKSVYDMAIIGAGPAGLNASVYASRYGLKNVVVGEITGGLTTKTHEIGNWLGEKNIAGYEFAQKSADHVRSLGAEIIPSMVGHIEKEKGVFSLTLSNGDNIKSKTVLLATGTKHRHLGIPGEKEFSGKGVSYCATCDGFFFKGKTVGVVGGNDSAVGAAVYLGDIAEKVYVIYRRGELRAEPFWLKAVGSKDNVEVITNTNVVEIQGKNKLEGVVLDSGHAGSRNLPLDGLFIEIGFDPNTDLVDGLGVDLDEEGYIKVDAEGRTNVDGVWAAGDITTGSAKFKQIITAAAEGAIAARSAQEYLKR